MNSPWIVDKYRQMFLTVNPAVAIRMLGGQDTVDLILDRGVTALQRGVRASTVTRYVQAMTAGEWDRPELQSPLRFTDKGVCFDGKHRLLSIIKSGVTLQMKVEAGIPVKDASELINIDTGMRRDPKATGEVLLGERISTTGMAIATRMLNRNGASASESQAARVTFYADHIEAISWAAGLHSAKQIKGLASSVLSVVARASYTVPRARLERFVSILATGTYDSHVPGEHMAVRLRHFMSTLGATGTTIRTTLYWKTEIALSLFLQGKDVSQIKVPSEPVELFPLPGEKA